MLVYRNGKVVGKIEVGVFSKKVNESRHLLHSKGSVPALDAEAWDTYSKTVSQIEIRTDKGRVFKMSKEEFEKRKEKFNLGWGEQYFVPKEFWEIESRSPADVGKLF